MQPSQRIGLALFLLLALTAGVLGRDVARRLEQGGHLRLELGRVRPTALAPRTLERFRRLEERVLATYYVSPPESMPAEMRRMQLEVSDLLEALHARFPERFDFQVVDPEAGAGLQGFAARRRISPFRVRSVTRDAWDERTVYSTLALSFGAHPEALLRGLRPQHLPYLQELLVAWLDELESPRAPHILLAAPPGFEELADELQARGSLERVDLDGGASLPAADVLLWLHPRAVTGEQLRELERYLAAGGSALVAGSTWGIDESEREGVPHVAFRREESAVDQIATHFGLSVEPGLVLDTTAEELEFATDKVLAPHWIRCIAPNQDFHRFAGQPNGTLLFRAPGPFTPEPARLRELGWTADVLATTSDGAWLEPTDGTERPLAELKKAEGSAVAKQALVVGLQHDDPWHGELIFAAADTPFADGFFRRPHSAHPRLLDVLLDEMSSSERLVLASIHLERPAPLPELAPLARIAWRAFAIGLPVALVLLVALLRRGFPADRSASGTLLRRARGALVPLVAGLLALVFVRTARAFDVTLDLTADGTNELSPASRAIAARAGQGGEVTATLFLSAPETLLPELRAPARRLEALLGDLGRAGARFALERVQPEALDERARAGLAEAGIPTYQGVATDETSTHVARFTCALRLARGGRTVVLGFPDARAFERAEFRLAFALERLAGLAVPRIAFASDVPRLSAAEAYEQYQQKSLFAPSGTDVYALARAALEREDLTVTHVNPRAPELPADADVLVWLQPRRSIEGMLAETVRYLHGGGKVLLAAQHFRVESQQFRGGDFELQYWPQPQNPDLELLYLPELSIELVREVLFDALCVPVASETQMTGRQGARDFERQDSARPFQIRASAANLAPHPLTRHLGDQALLCANRLRWDEARLAELGIHATPLVFTSEKTWSFAWKGGWIPHELLRGPVALEGSSGSEYLGRQPLAALFEGVFPEPKGPMRLDQLAPAKPATSPASDGAPGPATDAGPAERPWPAPAPGKLLLIGDSEFLRNGSLLEPDYRGDQLLWNAVATLAFEPELAELATRAQNPRGFGYVEPRARLLLRATVIAGGPLFLLLATVVATLVRSRSPRARGARARS